MGGPIDPLLRVALDEDGDLAEFVSELCEVTRAAAKVALAGV